MNSFSGISRFTAALCFCTVVILSSCSRVGDEAGFSGGDARRPATLITLPTAKGESFVALPNGQLQLTYRLKQAYPPNGVLAGLAQRMGALGQEPQREDVFQQGRPTSFVTGWSELEDNTQIPSLRIHRWMTDWKDTAGNVTRYALEYHYPVNSPPDLSSLFVTGLYTPAGMVEALRQQAIRLR